MLTVGRIVHYKENGEVYAAMVVGTHMIPGTQIVRDDLADLKVFKGKDDTYAEAVEFDNKSSEGKWFWPPRAYNQ